MCHLPQSKVKDDFSPRFRGNAQAQLSKQTLAQADATSWHEMLTLSSHENTNPFPKQTKALPWTRKKRTFLRLCFKCCWKTEAGCQMIREIYLFLYHLWTRFPPGPITVWLILAGVKTGETSDPHACPNLQHHHGKGKDQPQSSSDHVLSPLVNAATNHEKGDGLGLLLSTDPT